MSEEVSKFLCYGLIDPRNGELRYVGKSSSGLARPEIHRMPSGRSGNVGRSYRGSWLRQMWADGETLPSILVLQECESEAAALACEVQLIARFRAAEFNLTNLTDGGEGLRGHVATPETRAKMSAARKGRVLSPEHRAALAAANIGRVVTAETRAKLSAANVGKVASPGTRAKMSASKKGHAVSAEARLHMSLAERGKIISPETRAKIGAANRNPSAETRAKMSASQRKRVASSETRAKMSAAHKGKMMSLETCAKMSAAKKQWWVEKQRAVKPGDVSTKKETHVS